LRVEPVLDGVPAIASAVLGRAVDGRKGIAKAVLCDGRAPYRRGMVREAVRPGALRELLDVDVGGGNQGCEVVQESENKDDAKYGIKRWLSGCHAEVSRVDVGDETEESASNPGSEVQNCSSRNLGLAGGQLA